MTQNKLEQPSQNQIYIDRLFEKEANTKVGKKDFVTHPFPCTSRPPSLMSGLNNGSTAPKRGIFLNAIKGASHHKLPIHHNSPSNASGICQNIVLVLQWQLMLLLSAPFRVSPSVPKMDRIAIIENLINLILKYAQFP